MRHANIGPAITATRLWSVKWGEEWLEAGRGLWLELPLPSAAAAPLDGMAFLDNELNRGHCGLLESDTPAFRVIHASITRASAAAKRALMVTRRSGWSIV